MSHSDFTKFESWVKVVGEDVDDYYRLVGYDEKNYFIESFNGSCSEYSISGMLRPNSDVTTIRATRNETESGKSSTSFSVSTHEIRPTNRKFTEPSP